MSMNEDDAHLEGTWTPGDDTSSELSLTVPLPPRVRTCHRSRFRSMRPLPGRSAS